MYLLYKLRTVKRSNINEKVRNEQKVSVRADEQNDTVISNIKNGEIIIRNVDTNLVLTMDRANGSRDSVELSIVGQAYIKDMNGQLKASAFSQSLISN